MDIDTNRNQSQEPVSWRFFWFVYPVLAIVVVGFAWLVVGWQIERSTATIIQSERAVVERYVDLVSRQLRQAAVDVCAFARQNELHQYLEEGDNNALVLGAQEFLTRMGLSGTYDHVRFIDTDGAEHVRVNFNEGAPSIVPQDQLQTKSERYYVSQLQEISGEQIYISPIDLNVERGEIELPHKPVMRFGSSVNDSDGRSMGFVIINVLANPMLDAVIEQSRFHYGNPMLLNAQGYWIVDPTMPSGWGFLYPAFADERMSVVYPDEWDLFRENKSGTFRTENGLFTFSNYLPIEEVGYCEHTQALNVAELDGAPRWILASHVPEDDLRQAAWRIRRQMAIPTILTLILLAIVTRVITVKVIRRRVRDRILEHRAEIDVLTGLANRAAFEDQLREEAARADKQGSKFAVILADLDGFKAINDSLGHKAGDRVLKQVAQAFLESGRSTDTPARLGGDEFVVLLSGVADAEAAKRVAEMLLHRIRLIHEGGFQVGASLGISIYPDHTTDPAEAIVLADKAMYAAKRRGKNAVSIASDLERGVGAL